MPSIAPSPDPTTPQFSPPLAPAQDASHEAQALVDYYRDLKAEVLEAREHGTTPDILAIAERLHQRAEALDHGTETRQQDQGMGY